MSQADADEFEERVTRESVRRLMAPIRGILKSTQRLLAIFFVVVIVLTTFLQFEYASQNARRNDAFRKLQVSQQETQQAARDAVDSANKAQAAAAAAKADLDAAITAGQQGANTQAAIAHALVQIDCIAHNRQPCP